MIPGEGGREETEWDEEGVEALVGTVGRNDVSR